jgi:hypothetical protein
VIEPNRFGGPLTRKINVAASVVRKPRNDLKYIQLFAKRTVLELIKKYFGGWVAQSV